MSINSYLRHFLKNYIITMINQIISFLTRKLNILYRKEYQQDDIIIDLYNLHHKTWRPYSTFWLCKKYWIIDRKKTSYIIRSLSRELNKIKNLDQNNYISKTNIILEKYWNKILEISTLPPFK